MHSRCGTGTAAAIGVADTTRPYSLAHAPVGATESSAALVRGNLDPMLTNDLPIDGHSPRPRQRIGAGFG